jgi:hypothetical protein
VPQACLRPIRRMQRAAALMLEAEKPLGFIQ